MRTITHCPACQTQFFVTEEQLNKHDGKVRCGQCLHVFDAKAQFVAITTNTVETETPDTHSPAESNATAPNTSAPEWPLIHDELLSDDDLPNQKQPPDTETYESAADNIAALTDETTNTPIVSGDVGANDTDNSKTIENLGEVSDSITNKIEFGTQQPSYFDDFVSKTKFKTKNTAKKSRRWLWALGAFLLLLMASAQSIYFLRDKIATNYPDFKPYLVKACFQLSCSINLPKQIEFIVIDDSDMQEDVDHPGLMHLSSNLINTGTLNLAYPKLELTLTDVEDKPILRRIFKPNEYLPAGTDIAGGFKAREEVRIKLAITTQNIAVAGYRVFVTY